MHRKRGMELLVISSGPTLARTLRLQRYGHDLAVRQVPQDAITLEGTETERAALIVVDLGPDHAGWLELCERLGAGRTIPLIFLLPKWDPLMAAAILDHGADDCLPKPFDPDELLLRIHAILRRTGPEWDVPGNSVDLEGTRMLETSLPRRRT